MRISQMGLLSACVWATIDGEDVPDGTFAVDRAGGYVDYFVTDADLNDVCDETGKPLPPRRQYGKVRIGLLPPQLCMRRLRKRLAFWVPRLGRVREWRMTERALERQAAQSQLGL